MDHFDERTDHPIELNITPQFMQAYKVFCEDRGVKQVAPIIIVKAMMAGKAEAHQWVYAHEGMLFVYDPEECDEWIIGTVD